MIQHNNYHHPCLVVKIVVKTANLHHKPLSPNRFNPRYVNASLVLNLGSLLVCLLVSADNAKHHQPHTHAHNLKSKALRPANLKRGKVE